MKTVVTGVFSAVIGGLILFFAQQMWSARQAAQQQRIDFNMVAEDLLLSKVELNNILKSIKEYDTGANLSVVTAKNVGTDDIANKSFSAADANIIAFGTIRSPNLNPQNVTTLYDKGVLTLKYRYLPADAEHKFWVARTYPTVGEYEFAPDAPGVITTNSPDPYPDMDFPWFWFGAIIVGLVIFVIGGVLGELSAADTLKKRGLDYTKIKEQPLVKDEPRLPLSEE